MPDILISQHGFGISTYAGKNSKIVFYDLEHVGVNIGKYCSIANEVTIMGSGAGHYMEWITQFPLIKSKHLQNVPRPRCERQNYTIIENDIWLAHSCVILGGVKVNNGASVAACSVVTKDVPPYCLVAGNPARIIKKRFTDKQIEELSKNSLVGLASQNSQS